MKNEASPDSMRAGLSDERAEIITYGIASQLLDAESDGLRAMAKLLLGLNADERQYLLTTIADDSPLIFRDPYRLVLSRLKRERCHKLLSRRELAAALMEMSPGLELTRPQLAQLEGMRQQFPDRIACKEALESYFQLPLKELLNRIEA
jgi:hypothetical protein